MSIFVLLLEKPSEIKEGYSENLLMYGRNYKVYTHSYLCFGANEAMRKLKAYLVVVSLISQIQAFLNRKKQTQKYWTA